MTDLAKSYWDKRYTAGLTSGYGSYGVALERKVAFLKGFDIKSISEIGCGDFNFGKSILEENYPDATYTGYDFSSVIINQNKRKYPSYSFTNEFDLPQSDLLLCVDVLFHILDDNEVEPLLQRIEGLWTKYLAITAYEEDQDLQSEHVRIRKFDYKRFGDPIVRAVTEATEPPLYFYLFKK